MTYDIFFEKAYESIEQIEVFIRSNKLETMITLDHLCYKCESHEEFTMIREILEEKGDYLYESWIGDRLIALIKLTEPLSTSFGPISFIELQDQKPAGTQKSGFSHLEAYPKDVAYGDILEYLKGQEVSVIEDPTPHHPIHEVELSPSFVFRLEQEPIIEKIKREEL